MKKSAFKQFIREEIKHKLSETTIVDKNTDSSQASIIASDEGTDEDTVQKAISTAKISGQPVTIAEGFPSEFELEPPVMRFLKSEGVKQSINGKQLFFPLEIYQDLQEHNSDFKKNFVACYEIDDRARALKILSSLKISLKTGNYTIIKEKKYITLNGYPTPGGGFKFGYSYNKK